MAALTEKIRADMTAAMKAQEKERLSTLRDERVDSQAVYIGTAFKF